jgi:hypothetical protein
VYLFVQTSLEISSSLYKHSWNSSFHRRIGTPDGQLNDDLIAFDLDGDGELDWKEIIEAVTEGQVCISRSLLLERLNLEHSLFVMMIKFFNFIMYFCFLLAALYEFYPSEQIGDVKNLLSDHFNLDAESLSDVG